MSQAAQNGGPVVGVLNIDKPQGLTSHDVVARVRRLATQRRVGHAGTLDPMATGVLVVCLDKATRIIEYLADLPKSYRATIHMGVVTDTWDAEGEVVDSGSAGAEEWQALTLDEIERALEQFRGQIQQVPPMYSAIKHKGQPLYRLARQGVTVEREPRTVEIHDIRIIAWHAPELVIEVDCSKGTYIRALAHDLGRALGPGAHLSGLVRLAVGHLRLEDAVDLDVLEKEGRTGSSPGLWRQHVWPLCDASDRNPLAHLPAVTVDADTVRSIGFGQAVELDVPSDGPLLCAYDERGCLVAVLKPGDAPGMWRPHKVLIS